MKKTIQALGAIMLCQLAGVVGSVFTTPAVKDWLPTLAKPSFFPPNWLFAPVWLTLYTMMGLALFLVWRQQQEGKPAVGAISLFLVHLGLNAAWSIVFFGLKDIASALAVIIVLWLMIVVLIAWFYRLSKPAAWLLIPYLAWVSFASALNYAIWQLNR